MEPREILPGVLAWSAWHEGIGQNVWSCLVTGPDVETVIIDPLLPEGGLDWLERQGPPVHALLTNRLHHRSCGELRERFGTTAWCARPGMHAFDDARPVEPFEHGETVAGGLTALPVGVICPEETAFLRPATGDVPGLLAIGDALVEQDGMLGFVPDQLLGDDPESIRSGLKDSLGRVLENDFDAVVMAHGGPRSSGARAELGRFLESVKG